MTFSSMSLRTPQHEGTLEAGACRLAGEHDAVPPRSPRDPRPRGNKATAIKADIDGCRPQWRSQQVGSQISGTGVAGSGGGQGHGRKLQADDAPTERMEG